MKKLIAIIVSVVLILSLTSCKKAGSEKKEVPANESQEMKNVEAPAKDDTLITPAAVPDVTKEKELTDDQALSAIKNYCFTSNPDLEGIVNAGTYPVYWCVASSDEHEVVILFRSYTGAQVRYYIDRATGDTYVTESVPEISPEETKTEESFNVWEYLD